jgi:hypothetical protein
MNFEKKSDNKGNNFLKKILKLVKENFLTDDVKNEIKGELIEPLYIEIRNFILPHYFIFIILFISIIILLLYIIHLIFNINK